MMQYDAITYVEVTAIRFAKRQLNKLIRITIRTVATRSNRLITRDTNYVARYYVEAKLYHDLQGDAILRNHPSLLRCTKPYRLATSSPENGMTLSRRQLNAKAPRSPTLDGGRTREPMRKLKMASCSRSNSVAMPAQMARPDMQEEQG
jgi:hypothetical protein